MALKALMIKKRLDEKRKALEELIKKDESFSLREAEIAAAIDEASTEEEMKAVEETADAFETEKKDHEDAKSALEGEIEQLEKDLAEEEKRQNETGKPVEGKDETNMPEIRDRFFKTSAEERAKIFASENVRNWLNNVRAIMRSGVTNGKLLIPVEVLPMLREVIEESSKMIKHVNLQRITGDGTMVVDGGYPEAVWTEMCGKLNELTIGFYNVEIGGYKVGGFVSVCNALLEDSDIALAAEIITKLGRAIGYALDKAILYGTGTKMPLGILPRLAQTEAPASYPATARPWADLHTSNIIKISAANSTGVKLFQEIVKAFGAADNKFANDGVWWAMNAKTKTTLISEALSVNAAGAIVSGVNDTMPVIGGKIETLAFIPENVIFVGYDLLYLLAERSGLKTGESEHVRWTDDETVFKATARYDGTPVVAEGFVVIGINNTSVDPTAVSFEPDNANSVQSITLNTATASVAAGSTIKLIATTAPGKGTVTWTSATEAKATVDASGVVTGVAAGSSVITASCNGKTASCTVTVTS